MKILCYNLNGIRSAMSKGLINFLQTDTFDIVCVQETKAQIDQVDVAAFEALGYHHHFVSAEKKGYSGVATFSKQKATFVQYGMDVPEFDFEGRVLRTDFDDLTLLNIYFPSGTSGEERQAVKYKFLDAIYMHVENILKERPRTIVVGDYNVAHTALDIHNAKSNEKSSGFLPEERAWMTRWLTELNFADAFRHKNPEMRQYSWWSTRFNSRAQNKGWRIDYQSVSAALKNNIVSCVQLNDIIHSDHCPVLMEIELI